MQSNKKYISKNDLLMKLLNNEKSEEEEIKTYTPKKQTYKKFNISKNTSPKNNQQSIKKKQINYLKELEELKKKNYKNILINKELKNQNNLLKTEIQDYEDFVKNIFENILSIYYNISKNNTSVEKIFNNIKEYLKVNIRTLTDFNLNEEFENIELEKIQFFENLNNETNKNVINSSNKKNLFTFGENSLGENLTHINNINIKLNLNKDDYSCKADFNFSDNQSKYSSNKKFSSKKKQFINSSSKKNKNNSSSKIKKIKRKFIVLYDFDGAEKGDLKIKAGDELILLKENPDGWNELKNIKTKKIGNVPINFIKEIN